MKTLPSERNVVLKSVAESLGIQIVELKVPKNEDFDFSLRISSLPRPEGFSIKISEGLASWKLELSLDSFSNDLLRLFSNIFLMRKKDIFASIDSGVDLSIETRFLINNEDILSYDQKKEWNQIDLVVLLRFFEESLKYLSLKTSLIHFLSLLLPLFTEDPTLENEEISHTDLSIYGEEEGALVRIMTNKYERSRINRSKCLAFYGFSCQGCGLVLEEKYGPIGINTIHVHHLTPVSQLGDSVIVNPIKDLIPLCPNCHLIVHRKNPPIEMTKLKKMISNANNQN